MQISFVASASFVADGKFVVTEEKRHFFILFEESISVLLPVQVFWHVPFLAHVTVLLLTKRGDNFSCSLRRRRFLFSAK